MLSAGVVGIIGAGITSRQVEHFKGFPDIQAAYFAMGAGMAYVGSVTAFYGAQALIKGDV